MDLATGIKALELTATDQQISALDRYIALLLRWNRAYNLISSDTEQQIIPRHILDSLSISQYLQGDLIADVGTGAGLPGLPLAILNPDKLFYLIESNGKRTRFLTQCQIELPLKNIHIVKQRAEEYHPDTRFDTVLTRAFANVHDSVQLTQHLIADHGILLAMHGQTPAEPDRLMPCGFKVMQIIPLKVPGLDASRHLVELAKKE